MKVRHVIRDMNQAVVKMSSETLSGSEQE